MDEIKLDQILNEVRELLIAKDLHYGSKNLDKYGFPGITMRMSDKLARLENLTSTGVFQETIKDTLMDLIGYALHYLMRLEGKT